MLGLAVCNLLSKGAYTTDSIGGIGLIRIRCREAEYNLVQKVVDEEHLSARVTICPVYTTIECSVCHIEGSLPDVGEFCIGMN